MADDLNNLNADSMNITCDSFVAPSEEDNTLIKLGDNLDNKIEKPLENKQHFRDVLQDRVLRRLQEKAEYGKRNINSPEAKTPPLKRYFSNEDLWKRVEDRVAAKRASSIGNQPPRNDEIKTQKENLKSNSSEEIKNRIRSMSKAMGLASSIQNQIKSSKQPVTQHSDFLNPVSKSSNSQSIFNLFLASIKQIYFLDTRVFRRG